MKILTSAGVEVTCHVNGSVLTWLWSGCVVPAFSIVVDEP